MAELPGFRATPPSAKTSRRRLENRVSYLMHLMPALDLRDEYSESDLEAALIQDLADFLLELGDDFAFGGGSGG